jgi:hypothetical protein
MVGALALARIEHDKKGRKKTALSLDLDAYPRIPV